MKNKAEREQFLKSYRGWELIGNVRLHGARLNFYQHYFMNYAHVVATECDYGDKGNEVRYNLVVPDDDNYNPFDKHSGRTPQEFRAYNLSGCSIGTIVDYMTKRRDVI